MNTKQYDTFCNEFTESTGFEFEQGIYQLRAFTRERKKEYSLTLVCEFLQLCFNYGGIVKDVKQYLFNKYKGDTPHCKTMNEVLNLITTN